jgi:hypothetical protein
MTVEGARAVEGVWVVKGAWGARGGATMSSDMMWVSDNEEERKKNEENDVNIVGQ